MVDPSISEAIQALGLPASTEVARAAGGASGSAWQARTPAGSYVLRLSGSARVTGGRLAAMAAARAAGLPAPELVRRATTSAGEALLLSWLPGTTLLDALAAHPARATHWGRRMGEMQRRLHAVAAPSEVTSAIADPGHPFSAGRNIPNLPDGDRLLHLDWHPLNLLVDGGAGDITGIVDWDNARRGHPLLDLARTNSILSIEPALDSLPRTVRVALATLRQAWIDGYGLEAATIPTSCNLWAGRVMLADLEPRYRHSPSVLEPVRCWTAGWA